MANKTKKFSLFSDKNSGGSCFMSTHSAVVQARPHSLGWLCQDSWTVTLTPAARWALPPPPRANPPKKRNTRHTLLLAKPAHPIGKDPSPVSETVRANHCWPAMDTFSIEISAAQVSEQVISSSPWKPLGFFPSIFSRGRWKGRAGNGFKLTKTA